jgi:prepilin-type N-terminal cleavage/methylation domain-containing protein
MIKSRKQPNGYSLVELLVATVLFTIIAGTVFSLLLGAQLRYKGESDVTNAFQQANVAIDQITRDVHSAGYPPASSFAAPATLAQRNQQYPKLMALPFSWSPGYTNTPPTPCTVLGSCGAVPGDYDLVLETDTGDGNGVQWIRYSLQGTTLMRGVTPKVAWADPVGSTSAAGVLLPYLDNVMNESKSRAVFSYCSDTGCGAAAGLVSNILWVNVTLIVQSTQPDPQTGQFRTITLTGTGQAVRFNPND